MKKVILLFMFTILILQGVFAIDLTIQKISQTNVLIPDLGKSVNLKVDITNNGATGNFNIYNLAGFEISPETLYLTAGETKTVEFNFTPIGDLSKYKNSYYTLAYNITAQDSSELKQQITFKIVDLKDAFEVGSGDVDPESKSIEIYIKNLENFNFGDVSVEFSSPFFKVSKDFTIGPNERRALSVQLNQDDFRTLMAGFYTVKADITTGGKTTTIEGVIKFVEKDLITTTKKDYGFFVNTQIIDKTNEGNVLAQSETVIKKNILSRLFTTVSPSPDIVERQGLNIYYTWNKEIKPGETLEIQVKTNWIFPLILILFVVAVVVLVKRSTGRNIVLNKRVTFVRAKGGEFALRVSVAVQAKRYLERVNIIDRLPPLVSIHEKFGGDQPTRVDEKNRRIEWNFEKLDAGEIRIISYIIYSKVGVFGKFALPTATAVYEKEGEIHEAESNRAFFVAEQRKIVEE